MQIRDIMTRDVEVVPIDAPVREAAAKMKQLDVGAIPVCDGQKLTGVLTDRDIAVRLNADDRIRGYAVESENFESIHNHSAYARIARDKDEQAA